MKTRTFGTLIQIATALALFSSHRAAASEVAYIRGATVPWAVTNNELAMDRAFGSGDWDDLRLADGAGPFSGSSYGVIFVDGSDSTAIELSNYLTSNGAAISAWVNAGGSLILNSAPNQGSSFSMGFGVTLNYPTFASNVSAANPAHPIFLGPFLPTATAMSGNSYSHATVSGGSLTPIIVRDTGPDVVLGETAIGAGHVIFGGMTMDYFHSPQPQAANVRANMLVHACKSSGTLADNDSDGFPNTCDNCLAVTNPAQTDCDGDSNGDACDVDSVDGDGDGVDAACDNCPTDANPGQEDTDSNGLGDACNGAEDSDSDEWADSLDNCPTDANAGQEDTDSDGFGDACDTCVGPGPDDMDSDGICALADNCPAVTNPDQTDCDGDSNGDACDADSVDADGDGVDDACDNCPSDANPGQEDTDLFPVVLDLAANYADALELGATIAASPFLNGRGPLAGTSVEFSCGSCPSATFLDAVTQLGGGPSICGYSGNLFGQLIANDDTICARSTLSERTYEIDLLSHFQNSGCIDADSGASCIASGGFTSYLRNDGIGDACDTCAGPGPDDTDSDGICDLADNCPAVTNPAQTDCDGDSNGDACDVDSVDADGDGADDACDNCPSDPNPGQEDTDSDGFGNACDACVGSGPDDMDSDGICDPEDNCPNDANPGQEDRDNSGIGDFCNDALDADGDEFEDGLDNCPNDPNPMVTNSGAGALSQLLYGLETNNAAISALVPTPYNFFEGTTGTSIGDGGNDMYDGGNVLNTNLATAIPYTNGVITASDALFGLGSSYFTAKYTGLFVMAATDLSITQFQITGNNGADGGGSVDGAVLSTSVGGLDYTIYVKRVFNASDPSINHIVIVPGDGTGVTHSFATNTNDDLHTIDGIGSVDSIFYLLVARQSGQHLDDPDVLNIVNEFLFNLGQIDSDGDGVGDACDIVTVLTPMRAYLYRGRANGNDNGKLVLLMDVDDPSGMLPGNLLADAVTVTVGDAGGSWLVSRILTGCVQRASRVVCRPNSDLRAVIKPARNSPNKWSMRVSMRALTDAETGLTSATVDNPIEAPVSIDLESGLDVSTAQISACNAKRHFALVCKVQ